MKKIWLVLIFLLNLTPNISNGTFTLTGMNKMFAQLGVNEFICEDEFGESFDSSVPCDMIACVSTCPTCGEQGICEDDHVCPDVECETCGEFYPAGGFHECSSIRCSQCGIDYYPVKGHYCSGGNGNNGGDGGSNNNDSGIGENSNQNQNNNQDNNQNDNIYIPPKDEEEIIGNTPTPVEKTPCDKVLSLNTDSIFQHNLDSLTQELLKNEGNTAYPEKMWYKTTDGDFYWSTGDHSSVSPTPEILSSINGVEITEHFHTHPSGGSMPSPSDIKAIINDYNRGNINKETYNYGIIGSRFVTAIHINSMNEFISFSESLNYEEFKTELNEEIINHSSDTTADHSLQGNLNRFIEIISDYNTGLGFSFTKHESVIENDIESIQIEELTPVINGESLTQIDC